MTEDELEFLISQHFDDTLDAAGEATLQRALSGSADARQLMATHGALDRALRASSRSVQFDGDRLAARIAARIDERPERSLKMPVWTWAAPLSIAAGLAIVLSLGVFFHRDNDPSDRPTPVAVAVPRIDVTGPAAAPVATGGGYATISVGVPLNLTPAIVSALYLSDASMVGRVSIRPAGERTPGRWE